MVMITLEPLYKHQYKCTHLHAKLMEHSIYEKASPGGDFYGHKHFKIQTAELKQGRKIAEYMCNNNNADSRL